MATRPTTTGACRTTCLLNEAPHNDNVLQTLLKRMQWRMPNGAPCRMASWKSEAEPLGMVAHSPEFNWFNHLVIYMCPRFLASIS
eukprot:632906-Amphidinium_carterae.1